MSTRRVSPADLATGQFNFTDRVDRTGDIKTFGGTVPPESLAAGRCLIEFTDTPQPSTFPDLTRFRDGTAILSTTKQLHWDTSNQGFFTINTPGTKGLIGFAPGTPQHLGDVTIDLHSPYASILLTSLDRTPLSTCKRALLTVVARTSNTGFRYFSIDNRILDNGRPPILLEPVRATLTLPRPISAINILTHSGHRSGQTLSASANRFIIDGTRDKALHYEVELR